MAYLNETEKEKYINDLNSFCKSLMNAPIEQRKDFLINFSLYSRENITQEWFNILNIVRHTGNSGECNTVVKWRSIYNQGSDSKIKPLKDTKSILIIFPSVTQEIDLKEKVKRHKLHWSFSHLFSRDMMVIPEGLIPPKTSSVFQKIVLIGHSEKLDEKIEMRNMVDWADIDKFINCYLNDLVEEQATFFLIRYTKREFHFFFELIKYCFVVCSDFYDSDDIEEADIPLPDIKFLKDHDPFFIFHDISFVVRRFTPYLAEKFKEYTEYEIKFQEERRLIERMRMGIRGRIESAKERLEEEGG